MLNNILTKNSAWSGGKWHKILKNKVRQILIEVESDFTDSTVVFDTMSHPGHSFLDNSGKTILVKLFYNNLSHLLNE